MKTFVMAAVAATITAGAAMAHPVNEPHICGIDPDTLTEWPGYGTRGNIYDRGDYFFAVEVENFTPSIAYKHWDKVEGITNHIRIYKDDCRVSDIEIVHPESEPEVIAPAGPSQEQLDLEAKIAMLNDKSASSTAKADKLKKEIFDLINKKAKDKTKIKDNLQKRINRVVDLLAKATYKSQRGADQSVVDQLLDEVQAASVKVEEAYGGENNLKGNTSRLGNMAEKAAGHAAKAKNYDRRVKKNQKKLDAITTQ